ncbi:glucose-1-phosphate thymidylyltransferase RfbA [Candidatus Gracilibacteria bacterium]|nr:glucose-1-phosphate thymidylyltransferase RfbA [Candidatus Gracilibacteria bacterium]NUJ99026.1 glucose-1-phosphate thymidylyltransferase RfbA [Candidatus Gracilibacteria bacterium]
MKGIILAGGSGTRLYPITQAISKQLMPVYDKPMIYYPLSSLMLAGIQDILIITTPEDQSGFKKLLGDGKKWGIKLYYEIQEKPNGLAEAFIIGEKFIGDDDICLILGDNIFYGQGFSLLLQNIKEKVKETRSAYIFGYAVNDPERSGVVEFDSNKNVISIEEKPQNPKSNYAIPGLYFYTNESIEIAKKVQPSKRGELEITDIHIAYLKKGKLKVEILNRGYAWLDTGTHESMLEASNFIEIIEKRQGFKIACPEEIAYLNGWISKEKLEELAKPLLKSNYGKYLLRLIQK